VKDYSPLLAVLIVVAGVIIAVLLSVKTYATGGDIGLGWAGLLGTIFGATLGLKSLAERRQEPDKPTPPPSPIRKEDDHL
jgi:hypothetical protein